MSIDAVVKCVHINEDGAGRLELIDRPGGRGQNDGIAGQRALYFDSAPEEVTSLNGRPVWGNSSSLLIGDKQVARREGYTKIKFVDRNEFVEAVIQYTASLKARA